MRLFSNFACCSVLFFSRCSIGYSLFRILLAVVFAFLAVPYFARRTARTPANSLSRARTRLLTRPGKGPRVSDGRTRRFASTRRRPLIRWSAANILQWANINNCITDGSKKCVIFEEMCVVYFNRPPKEMRPWNCEWYMLTGSLVARC